MVTSSAVVGSSAMRTARMAGERHGDHHALAHAAGELVREGAGRMPGSGMPTCSSRPTARAGGGAPADGLVGEQGFGDLVADPVHRVQRGHRLLEDHGDLAAADCGACAASGRVRRSSVDPSARVRVACPRTSTPGGLPSSRIRASAVTLLPELDSPTSARVWPASSAEADAVDGVRPARTRCGS